MFVLLYVLLVISVLYLETPKLPHLWLGFETSHHFCVAGVRRQRLSHGGVFLPGIDRPVRHEFAELDRFDGARPDDVRPPLLEESKAARFVVTRGLPMDEVVGSLEGNLQEGVWAAFLPLYETLSESLEVQRVHVQVRRQIVQVVVGQDEVPLDHVDILESYPFWNVHACYWVHIGLRVLRAAISENKRSISVLKLLMILQG